MSDDPSESPATGVNQTNIRPESKRYRRAELDEEDPHGFLAAAEDDE